jgi:DNA-directed RNA polymerase specialized sigma24 family protein
MQTLTPEDRILIELVYWEGWKLKDAAVSFGWGVPKTKVRAMRAKQKLRKQIEKMIEDEG